MAEELFGSASVQQGFNYDGKNIHVGDHLIINYGDTILNAAEITTGDWVIASPHALISTVSHPLSPRGQRNRLNVEKPETSAATCESVAMPPSFRSSPSATAL